MSDLFDPLPVINRSSLQWVPDNEVQNCMTCFKGFSVVTRKHHCRKCGKVICSDCSPNKKKIAASDAYAVRVCNPCYTSVEEHFGSNEWTGQSSTEISVADPVIEGRLHVGQLYVKVVEAIGLPSSDAITGDPFVRLTLTGRASHGQEWSPELRSTRHTKYKNRTLNPRWDETFVFNVFAPGAELLMEVFNYGQLSRPTKLGEAHLSLSQLMDQRRHNKWMDLVATPKLRRFSQNDVQAGRIHVLLHYKFSRTAEFFSHFADEQPYVHEWPKFKAGQLYSNFWILLDDLWPYLEVIWTISPTLNWEKPTRTTMSLVTCIWMCLYIRWVPVFLHIVVIGITLRNYFDLAIKNCAQEIPRTIDATEGDVIDQNPTRRSYNLPPGLHHITNRMTHATMDLETKAAVQNVQNNMAWWSTIIKSIERMFSWENSFYTATILVILVLSCMLHVVVPNQYILLGFVLYLYAMWTIPFLFVTQCIRGFGAAVRSIIHQHRLLSACDKQERTSRAMVHKNESRTKNKRSLSNTLAHDIVSKKEEMFGAAANELSKRIAVQEKAL